MTPQLYFKYFAGNKFSKIFATVLFETIAGVQYPGKVLTTKLNDHSKPDSLFWYHY